MGGRAQSGPAQLQLIVYRGEVKPGAGRASVFSRKVRNLEFYVKYPESEMLATKSI